MHKARSRVREGGPTGNGWAWWGPHDRARRSAEFLLAVVATVCAAYVALVVVAVFVAIRIGQLGSRHGVHSWQHRLGILRLAIVTIVLIGVLAAVIACTASATLAARAARLADARVPVDGEADDARKSVETFALAVGFAAPTVHVVDERIPNGFAAGRRQSCAVCLTHGSLALPADQLDALCAQTITSVANRALPLTCAAADLVLVARWCTKAVWSVMAVLLVSTIVGVPPLFAASVTIAIALLVVCTMPMLAVADRAIPRLRDRSAQLADLGAVRLTNQPAALARLLLTTAADRRTVSTPWQIAHLWFDPDTSRPRPGAMERRFQMWSEMDPREGSSSYPTIRSAAHVRAALIERARVLIDQTSGDPALRAQLERVEKQRH